jgi:thioredoxin-like negative regulator of GroEL
MFDEAAQEYAGRMKFVKLNILEDPGNQEIASNYGVMSTPTLFFFCNGRPIGQAVGFMSEEDMRKTLDSVLGRHKSCLNQSSDLRSYVTWKPRFKEECFDCLCTRV